MFFLFIVFAISCLVLVRSGSWLVCSLSRIAQFLEWREFVVAFVLMAFATSVPEFFVGVTSAIHGKPELSFGNVIGSNIINLTLVVAIGAFLGKGLKAESALVQKSIVYTAVIAFLPLILILDGSLSRPDGVVLLLSLVFYLYQLGKGEERFKKVFSNSFNRSWVEFKLFLKDLGMFFAGLILLLAGAEGVVWSATRLAQATEVPLLVIGILIIALGTNLPEIIFGVKSVIKEHKEMLLGNVMGSVVANSTLVLGITFLIHPFEVSDLTPYITGIIFAVASILFFLIFSKTGKAISKKEAFFLLLVFFAFAAAELSL